MVAVVLDVFYVALSGCLGLLAVRLTGIALNARDRRRYKRCLANIERLEIANGYKQDAKTLRYSQMLSQRYGPGQILVKSGTSKSAVANLIREQMLASYFNPDGTVRRVMDMTD